MGLLCVIVTAVKCIVRVFMSALSHPLLPDGFLSGVLSYILDNRATIRLFYQHPMHLNIRSMIQPWGFFPESGFFLHMAEKNKKVLTAFTLLCHLFKCCCHKDRKSSNHFISFLFQFAPFAYFFNLISPFCPVLFYLAFLCYLDFFVVMVNVLAAGTQ